MKCTSSLPSPHLPANYAMNCFDIHVHTCHTPQNLGTGVIHEAFQKARSGNQRVQEMQEEVRQGELQSSLLRQAVPRRLSQRDQVSHAPVGEGERAMERLICGKAILYRTMCLGCGECVLSGSYKFECGCGAIFYAEDDVDNIRVVCEGSRRIPTSVRQKIVGRQGGRCYWCSRKFGVPYLKRGRIKKLTVHIDHTIPYAYSGASREEELVASCSVCNLLKSSKFFDNEEEVRVYLQEKWMDRLEKGIIQILEEPDDSRSDNRVSQDQG